MRKYILHKQDNSCDNNTNKKGDFLFKNSKLIYLAVCSLKKNKLLCTLQDPSERSERENISVFLARKWHLRVKK